MTSLPPTPDLAPTAPLPGVTDLVREYTLPREHLLRPPAKVQALKGVSFTLDSGGAAWAWWANRPGNPPWRAP